MKFSVLTLFPEMIEQAVSHSILGRALARDMFSLQVIDIRDHAINAYGKVDDQVYGGGTGMLLMAEPLLQATQDAIKDDAEGIRRRIIYLSPRGRVLSDPEVNRLAAEDHLVFVCGHYEGVDERYLLASGAEEISIGDYVVTGGELPALIMIDAVARCLPGVLPDREALQNESHHAGLLAEPQYTRPAVWQGLKVPDVLLSGHARNIEMWRLAKQVETTLLRRPDLAGLHDIDEATWAEIVAILKQHETNL